MVEKVISGGQAGGDEGALSGAKYLGILTGGTMPKGFLTEAGPRPEFASLYGMREHTSSLYPPRTFQNVKDSAGTLWLGETQSRGYRCTWNAINQYDRPFIVNPPSASFLRLWLEQWRITVLNCAGTRASHDSRMHQRMFELIVEALSGKEAAV